MSLQKGDLLLLNGNDDATLAKWWCQLNSWEWPDQIPDPEPEEKERPNRRGTIMDEICARIGIKACLREWNRERMSEEEFEEFWKTKRVPASVTERSSNGVKAQYGDNGS